jgi:hypothetical protein
MIQIPASLRTIADRLGFELTIVDDPDMPIEATRKGSRDLAMNFADLDRLVGWLDLHDRAAAMMTIEMPGGTSGQLPEADLRAWFLARGVSERDVQLYIGQNRGKTLEQLDAEYERLHGSLA